MHALSIYYFLERKNRFTLELVIEFEKQPQTQKPEILHTLTIKIKQTTLLDQVSYFAGGLADVVIGSHVRRHLSQIYPLLLSLLPLSFVDHCGVQEPLARYACVGGHNRAIMAADGLIGEET